MSYNVNMSLNKLRFLQNLLALSAVTLIITVWATVSFLIYQNNLLKKYANQTIKNVVTKKINSDNEDFQNWQTYINNKYKYEFSYPKEWYVLQDDDYGLKISNIYFDPSLNGVTPLPGEIFLNFYYFHSALENYSPKPQDTISTEGVKITKKGLFMNEDGSFGIISTRRSDEPTASSLDENINQILSTFKFINKTGTTPSPAPSFTCPPSGWIDCMPGPNKGCSQDVSEKAIEWYKSNCPNYQGIAY